jgi:hypothetical protein
MKPPPKLFAQIAKACEPAFTAVVDLSIPLMDVKPMIRTIQQPRRLVMVMTVTAVISYLADKKNIHFFMRNATVHNISIIIYYPFLGFQMEKSYKHGGYMMMILPKP